MRGGVNRASDPVAPPTRTPRGTWIDHGLQALAAGGPQAVRIDVLARELGVTRGGFYWHFENRGALLAELLEAWERRSLEEVIARVEGTGGDATAKLHELFTLAVERGEMLPVDLAVRDWARRDATVAERLRRVDTRRMDYLRELFRAAGREADDAEARSMLAFALWIGNHFVAADHGAYSRTEVLALARTHLLG